MRGWLPAGAAQSVFAARPRSGDPARTFPVRALRARDTALKELAALGEERIERHAFDRVEPGERALLNAGGDDLIRDDIRPAWRGGPGVVVHSPNSTSAAVTPEPLPRYHRIRP